MDILAYNYPLKPLKLFQLTSAGFDGVPCEKYAQKGLGSFIFRNVLLSILHLSKTKVGLRFITVEAYAMAFNFYVKKNNFTYRKSVHDRFISDVLEMEITEIIDPEKIIKQ